MASSILPPVALLTAAVLVLFLEVVFCVEWIDDELDVSADVSLIFPFGSRILFFAPLGGVGGHHGSEIEEDLASSRLGLTFRPNIRISFSVEIFVCLLFALLGPPSSGDCLSDCLVQELVCDANSVSGTA